MVDITITCNCCGVKEHNSFYSIENAIEYLQKKSKYDINSVYEERRTTGSVYEERRTTGSVYEERRTTG